MGFQSNNLEIKERISVIFPQRRLAAQSQIKPLLALHTHTHTRTRVTLSDHTGMTEHVASDLCASCGDANAEARLGTASTTDDDDDDWERRESE